MSRTAPQAEDDNKAVSILGPYQLRERLGQGGMGVVYRALRADRPQNLAIKILRPSQGRAAERFAREQEILAQLDHPSIVRFLDSGHSPGGDVYYVMELVDGLPIDQYCDAQKLGVRARVRLFIEVCTAVSHAHRHFVVHRDLKPANVLVDREGRPRLLDFGIAKWLDRAEAGGDTTRGATPMTLRYASPEQVRGQPVGVGTDVYSLTVMLFELLTGELPQPLSLDLFSLAIAIDRQVPPPASQLLRERGERAAAQALAGDLDEVLAKGLAKDPAERYPSVAALAADLGRYLEYQPVAARGRSPAQEVRYFIRRNPLGVAAASCGLLLLIVTAIVFAGQARALAAEKEKAERSRLQAEARVQLLDLVFLEADPLVGGPLLTVGQALDVVRLDIDKELAAGSVQGSALAATAAEAYWRLGRRESASALADHALASAVAHPPRELGILLAIGLFSRTADADAAVLPQVRAAMVKAGVSSCELAPEWEAAFAALGASPAQRSLAAELAFECALESLAPDAAEAALARTAELRSGLPADHPARSDLENLRRRWQQTRSGKAGEALP